MPRKAKIPMRLVLLLIVIWGIFCLRIGSHYFGVEDASRVWVPAAVRNYEIYGTDAIGLMIVRDTFPVQNPEERYYYSHHPPLIVWLPALLSKVAGNNELAIRFVFPAAMMIAVSAFYVFVRRLYGEDMAFWAVVFFSFAPIISYYQPSYGHDPLGFMAIFLFGANFVDWIKRPQRLSFLGLCFSAILAVWTAWPAVFFIVVFSIYAFLFGKNAQRIGVVLLGILSIVALAVMLLLYQSWWSEAIQSLIDSFFFRSSNLSLDIDSVPFTPLEWIGANSRDVLQFGGITLTILAFFGIGQLGKHGTKFANRMTLTMLLAGLSYLLVFRNAAIVHVYYEAFLMPALAISAAAAFIYGRRNKARFAKALTDAGLLAYLIQAVFVLAILVSSTYQASLDNIIRFINEQENLPEQLAVLYPLSVGGSDMAVEYYTQKDFQWHILPDELNPASDSLYIYCAETQDFVLSFFETPPPSTPIDQLCTAYTLEGN